MNYNEYIRNSPQWKALRQQALERDGYRCRGCNDDETVARLEVHHRYYPPRGEWHLDCVDALTTLCSECHFIIENRVKGRRYSNKPVPELPEHERLTPFILKDEKIHGLQVTDFADHQRITPVNAQWRAGRPVESASQSSCGNHGEAQED